MGGDDRLTGLGTSEDGGAHECDGNGSVVPNRAEAQVDSVSAALLTRRQRRWGAGRADADDGRQIGDLWELQRPGRRVNVKMFVEAGELRRRQAAGTPERCDALTRQGCNGSRQEETETNGHLGYAGLGRRRGAASSATPCTRTSGWNVPQIPSRSASRDGASTAENH